MKLFIYGNGGLGKEVFDIANRINKSQFKYKFIYFINDFEFDNIRVFSLEEIIKRDWHNKEHELIIATGEVRHRVDMLAKIKKHGFNLGKLIDPSAIISESAIINKGCIICSFVLIGPYSVIGENSLINVQSIIGHDIQIGDNTIISSMVNIGGDSIIENECFLGMSSVVKERKTIKFNSILSMGSVLHIDLPEKVLAIGNPARVIKRIDEDFKVF